MLFYLPLIYILSFFFIQSTTDCFVYPSLSSQIQLTEEERALRQHCFLDELIRIARILKIAGLPKEAKKFFHAALIQSPENLSVNWDLGDLYLLEGDFVRGMAGFRARWITNTQFKERLWQQEDLHGKKIAVFCQWGFGDTFMYLRYLKMLKSLGAYVICICQAPLKKILSQIDYIDNLVPYGQEIPSFDYQVPITYLPEIFKTTIETIPCEVPYLALDSTITDHWKNLLRYDKRFKVGLCWQGEKRDDPQTLNRSITFNQLAPLFKLKTVSFYSLQYEPSIHEIESLGSQCHILLFDESFDKKNGAFVDTAGVMQNLDLVITIDTSLAHLAGALNIPVWVMLPFANEWRFFEKRTTSPWYPSMRLFRQTKRDDWSSVIQAIADELQHYSNAKKGHE